MKTMFQKYGNRGAIAGFLLAGTIATGQSLTLTSPSSPVTVRDGDDFATSLAEPWDCNGVRDIACDYGFAPPSNPGGVWTATSLGNDYYYFFPLSPGFLRDSNYTNYQSYYTPGTPYGALNPLNANKYKCLSIRMSMQQSKRSLFTVFWTKSWNAWPAAQQHGVNFTDTEPTFTVLNQYTTVPHPTGFMIYDIDLTGATWMNEKVSSLSTPLQTFGGGWNGNVYGFQVWPTTDSSAGSQVQVDWARAYDPDTSPTVNITWNSVGIVNDGRTSIQIFIDTDNTGYDGDLFKAGVANDGSYTLKTAALPPGDYYIYLKAVRHQNSGFTVLAQSGYSGRIRVGQPPMLTFNAPGFTSGQDYATVELSNPWDMSDTNDVGFMSQINSPSFSGGRFTGVTAWPIAPYPESDDQIWLNNRKNGQVVPINPQKYRYLTFSMLVDPNPAYTSTFDRIARGWESRVIWWRNSVTTDGSYSKDIPLFEDWHTYTVDLWDNTFLENSAAIPAVPQLGWEEMPEITRVRFDPMEAHVPTRFWIDDIKLCAENKLANNQYTIQWDAVDADSSVVTVRLYYGTVNGSGVYSDSSASPFAVVSQAPGPGSYQWTPPQALMGGTYYIRADITDGTRSNSYRSKLPIKMVDGGSPPPPGPTSPTVPVWGDYNGDGRDDLAVYESSTGNWYIRSGANSNVLAFALNWGDSSMDPVPGDYDGDGKFDLAVYQRTTGNWYIRHVQDGLDPIAYGVNWGSSGMDPIPGDYDGDGKSDLCAYERATGNWFARRVSGTSPTIFYALSFGHQVLKPVPGDYDGDGVWDLAVMYPPKGWWFVYSVGLGQMITYGAKWGDSSMKAVHGDYNGDGKWDLAMYQQSSGKWYIRQLQDGLPAIANGSIWGNSNRERVHGDFNGDGHFDLGVCDVATAGWYVKPVSSSTPIINGVQWGFAP